MSLLSKASLVLTPNAVKEGKLYSIIPSSGNGDMVVTRATTATRVNSEGFVEETPYNLLKYSEDFSNASWTKSNSTITANTILAPNSSLTADKLVENSINIDHSIYRLGIPINGFFTISVYVKYFDKQWIALNVFTGFNNKIWFDLVNGQIGVTDSGVTGSIEKLRDSWFKITATRNTNSINCGIGIDFANSNGGSPIYQGNGTSGYYIWGAQLVQGSTPKEYFQTTDRLNVPRLNYDVAGGCPSILLEPQRTNLLTYSDRFGNATWNSVNSGISENIVISPSNALDGDILTEGTTNNVHSISNGTVVTSGVNNAVSLYVKKNNLSFFRLVLGDNITTTSWVCAQFNLDTLTYTSGVGTTGGVFVSASIASAGNGWYRCVLVGNIPTNGTALFGISPSNGNAITSSDSRGRASYLGIGRTIYIWGAQSETGSYETSYIPTVASTVTRSRDAMTLNNILTNNLISNIGGTWFINQKSIEFKGSAGNEYSLSVGSITTAIVFNLDASGNIRFRTYLASVTAINFLIPNSNVTPTKLAVSWDVNSGLVKLYFNGALVGSYTGQSFANYELLALSDINAGGVSGSHKVDSCMLFPTILTNSECIALTTLYYPSYSEMATNLNYTIQ